jgi:hypothetical protein
MNEIQCITNEWVDTLILNNIDNSIRRKIFSTEYGTYKFNNDILIIDWNYWGIENFNCIDGIYINLYNNIYNTELIEEHRKYNVSLDFMNKKVYNEKKFIGTFNIKKNNIHILFENSYKIYNIKEYGKYFIESNINNFNRNCINKTKIKLIAIVFPQYHRFYENDTFWGKGFTEWTLLKKMDKIVKDEFIKLPHKDIGYYNLKDYEHRKYMRMLTDKYNIYGFCYYHYWFGNKKVMYEPMELMLKDGEPNKPFFFCWANEQWTKRWDGGNNDILITQDYSDENGNIKHFTYLLDFFKHHNYIKKNNKPIFIFYRIEEKDVDDIKKIIELWNNLAIKNGFDGIHFMRYLGPFDNKIQIESIEGFVEFEPGYCMQKYYNEIMLKDEEQIFEKNNYDEKIYLKKNTDIDNLIKNGIIKNGYVHYSNISEEEKNIRLSKYFLYNGDVLYKRIIDIEKIYQEQHRGISVGWNNIPRRTYTTDEYSKYPHIWKNINIHNFTNCLEKLMEKIDKTPNKYYKINENNKDENNKDDNDKDDNDNFLFITAWNEWNEQSVLEPSNVDGYIYLNEISNTYLNYYNYPIKKHILYVSHIGGGTDKYMKDLEKIFPEYNFIRFIDEDVNNKDNKKDYNELYNFINIIHINSIINNEKFKNIYDDNINLINFLDSFESYVKKIITIHDFQWIFPDNPNILSEDFNRNILISNCNNKNIKYFEKILSKCDKIIFPDNMLYINYNKIINLSSYNNKIFIVNHCDKLIEYSNNYVSDIIDNTINIAFIGNFCDYKGKNVFINFSKRFKKYKNYNIVYHVFGENNGFNNDDNNKIILHNKYNDNEIIELLYKNNIHGIMHLSLFEETYCYALTNSINSGLPILHNNLGAFKNRLSCSEERFIIYQEDNDVYYFLDYIIKNNGIKNINTYISKDLQPTKWYIEHY